MNSTLSVGERINTNQSILGSDLLNWIKTDKDSKTPDQQNISRRLYHKYVVDRDGNLKDKIKPNIYYYVNYNNRQNANLYMAYIVRDKSRSPRQIPNNVATLDIVESDESYKGNLIQAWSYFHNGSSENEFYMEGNEIISKYFECSHPLRPNVFYFVNRTAKGIKVLRDTVKSPRAGIDD